MKVVYFGTPQFAADVLSYLLQHHVNIVGVVTKPDRPQGRSGAPVPTPVKCVAAAQHPPLPLLQPVLVSSPENLPLLEQFQADLFVVVAYGEIIKQHLLDLPKIACINLHASLLPKYRGAAPIQRALINGETETGVTIIHMAKKMDAGDMIATVKVPIAPNATYGQLEQELCHAGSTLLLETIRRLEAGTADRTPQQHDLATLAPKIEVDDCLIDWNAPAQTIHNLIRGVNPHPGAWCWVSVKGDKKRFRVIDTEIVSTEGHHPHPEFVLDHREGILVHCGTGTLRLLHVQLEGKKVVTSQEFSRGMGAAVTF